MTWESRWAVLSAFGCVECRCVFVSKWRCTIYTSIYLCMHLYTILDAGMGDGDFFTHTHDQCVYIIYKYIYIHNFICNDIYNILAPRGQDLCGTQSISKTPGSIYRKTTKSKLATLDQHHAGKNIREESPELAAKSCFQLFLGEKRHRFSMFNIGFKKKSPGFGPRFGPSASSSSLINPDGFKSYLFL